MTTLYTLGLLELAPADSAFIADFRRRHESRYGTSVPAHFTLVFGTDVIEHTAYVEHVRSVANRSAPIEFVLRRATIVHELAEGIGYVFLEPDEGSAELRALHEQLHGGVFARLPRRAAAYAPHVTVATARELELAERLHAELAAASREFRGAVRALTIGALRGLAFEVVATVELAASRRS